MNLESHVSWTPFRCRTPQQSMQGMKKKSIDHRYFVPEYLISSVSSHSLNISPLKIFGQIFETIALCEYIRCQRHMIICIQAKNSFFYRAV